MNKKKESKPCPHCGYHECPNCGKPIISKPYPTVYPTVYPWPWHPWMITNITTSGTDTYFTSI